MPNKSTSPAALFKPCHPVIEGDVFHITFFF